MYKGVASEEAAATVEEFADRGWVSDERFVEMFVRSRVNRSQGPVKIRAELAMRQINADTTHSALATEDWARLAREARRRRFGPDLPHTTDDKLRQMRFLQSRGFTPEQIRLALRPDETGD